MKVQFAAARFSQSILLLSRNIASSFSGAQKNGAPGITSKCAASVGLYFSCTKPLSPGFCATKSRSPYRLRQMHKIIRRNHLSLFHARQTVCRFSFKLFISVFLTTAVYFIFLPPFLYLLSRYTSVQRCIYYNLLFLLRQATFFILLYCPKILIYFWYFFTPPGALQKFASVCKNNI